MNIFPTFREDTYNINTHVPSNLLFIEKTKQIYNRFIIWHVESETLSSW